MEKRNEVAEDKTRCAHCGSVCRVVVQGVPLCYEHAPGRDKQAATPAPSLKNAADHLTSTTE